MGQAILTEHQPKDVGSALQDFSDLWFGEDALKSWLSGLTYRFSNAGPWPGNDADRVKANLQRGFIDAALVQSFVGKLASIEQTRRQYNCPDLPIGWKNLRLALSPPAGGTPASSAGGP